MMQKKDLLNIGIFLIIMLTVFSHCKSKSEHPTTSDLEFKKQTLEGLKKEVKKLESEIASLDTNTSTKNNNDNIKKVSTMLVIPQEFKHYIDLQGVLVNASDVLVMPLAGPGLIKALYVKEGSVVKKGDVILKTEDTTLINQRNILQTQLVFAKNIYDKQQKLWTEKIGSELQLLSSKNNVDNLENQLTNLNTMINYTKVSSPIDGVIDELNVKVGEFFTGMTATGETQVRVVDSKDLKIKVDVPENYASQIHVNAAVKIEFLENDATLFEKINAISKHINPQTRSFIAEIKLPNNPSLRANQIATVKILDYAVSHAKVIPINTVQVDEKGKYVYTIENKNGKKIAAKKHVFVKEIYGDNALITEGIQAQDEIIIEGYQNIVEGQEINILN